MISEILQVAFYLLSPLLILYLSQKFRFVNKIGVVVLAYILGIAAGNTGLISEEGKPVQEMIMTITIPLAIPLMLFSANLKQWSALAGKTAASMFIGLFVVIFMVIAGFFIFKDQGVADFWKIGGMLVGVYTGGTPNLAALKIMLEVDEEVYLLTHTYDMILSGVYFLFLISIGQRVFHFFLPPFRMQFNMQTAPSGHQSAMETYNGIFKKNTIRPLLGAFGLSLLIFLIAGSLSLLVSPNSQMVVVILAITTLGLTGSLIPQINRIEKTFELGMYLILVFSVVVSSMVDISGLSGSATHVLPYLALVVFGSLFMHMLLARFFRIDADTVIVTSAALICSPPFVPVVAGALKNRQIIVSGLTIGIVGYAVGNYLGFLVARLLKMLA
jgi:uncharacterized membrane protein